MRTSEYENQKEGEPERKGEPESGETETELQRLRAKEPKARDQRQPRAL
jgi:hypothetical protein